MRIDVNFQTNGSNDYTVYIDELGKLDMEGKVAIITNPKVSNLHLSSLKQRLRVDELHVITIPDGEHYKNMRTVENILKQLFQLKFNRSSTLIALGGGVIGDITGFCAAIYQRGISFIQIPTTLLAQIDASVGGKTGVNNEFGKNLIGAFHQPKAVYCESDFLQTLPKKEFNAGVAEIIKMAIVQDKSMFDWLESVNLYGDIILPKVISRSIKLKADIISKDEKETDLRKVLNYGHTFAHVIEKQTNYQTYLHGEAVAIGMCMANHLAMDIGLLTMVENERICELLQRYNLPLSYNISNIEKFYDEFFLDKKSLDDNILFVLPEHIGGYAFRDNIKKQQMLEMLRKFS